MKVDAGLVIPIGFVVVLLSYVATLYLPDPPPTIIGIDFGTSFSSAAYFVNGKGDLVVIPDHVTGKDSIPSVIAFYTNGTVLTGPEALAQAKKNPANTMFHLKRFIGRKFSDPVIQNDLEFYGFKVVGVDDKPFISITTDEGEKLWDPIELIALILKRIKTSAETHLNAKLTNVVLSVPVDYTDAQKNATIGAAASVGLKVLKTIYEPTAAAMAFGIHERTAFLTILVFDFGGGTLDISVMYANSGIFEVVAVQGDPHLGGEDFTHVIMDHFIGDEFKEKYDRDDLDKDLDFVQKLRLHAESAKIKLDDGPGVDIEFTHKFKDGQVVEFKEHLSKELFLKLSDDLFKRMFVPVEGALADAGLTRDDIDEVVAVGGTSKTPHIRKLIEEHFGLMLRDKVDPQQAVAMGTALQAAVCGRMWPLPVAAREAVGLKRPSDKKKDL